ncbi:tol-pal system protein YbgF [Trichlorobacter thiogenes]|uniref:Tol-pal system protein YbgF n=1 Tax=Trichlorobacter thiogenes TaxID=115783 RepID=A0A1T4JS62_9BACT|nr:tol-pal system protein YbgF [Trichlorobacter thiogenes]SJZ33026.1 tol-pal system protein YbgF [Trichlorobacter thiogenes]
MNHLQKLGLLALGTLLLGGCAANDLAVKRQTETETKVEHLFQIAGGIEARLNELSGRLATLEERDAQRTAVFKELSDGVRELKEVNQALQAKVQTAAVVATPKVEVVNPDPAPKGRDAGPPQGYVKAFGLYSTNNFSGAIQAFELFLKEQPASEYVPNAQYWIGECYYSVSDLPKALVAFQKVVDGWPRHLKASDALLKIGYSYAAQKQPDKAKASFERLIRSYPASPAAVKARERLMSSDQPASGRH